ncbi:MAG: sulfatase-like hydrolase/transferase [Bacteroidetes bacterium]|nr:sulfatase-like hydrolase/transferase [Bacteroidota bacterium]
MSGKNEKSESEKSFQTSKKDKNLFGRRKFIGTFAKIGAISLIPSGLGESKIPIWAGNLTNTKKRSVKIPDGLKPNGLNMIVIICDTFRADHISYYNSIGITNPYTSIKTPNLDKLAKDGVLFADVTTEGLPTIPARRVYHTGNSVLADAKTGMWHPLSNDDITFSQVLSKHGITTGFIVDTYHYFKPDYNFHRAFDSWQWIRGHETDKWKSGPKEKFDPKKHMPTHLWNEQYDRYMRQFMMNTQDRKSEEDYFTARSCRTAMKWLEQNINNKPFMLWLDMFSPHEPWDAPPRFQKMYRNKYPYERYLFGYGVRNKSNSGDNQDIRPDDLPVIRDLYAAEVTFSDYWIGRLLKKVEEMGLMDDTIIVFSTDHGTNLGEEGYVQKSPELLNACVTHIPLIIKHPDKKFTGKRVDGLVSAIDYMHTFLTLLGINDYKNMDGENMWKLVTGQVPAIHDNVYSVFDGFGAIHNLDWHYFQNINGGDNGEGPCLYDLKSDRNQTKNVIKEFPEVAKNLRNKLENHLKFEIPALKL